MVVVSCEQVWREISNYLDGDVDPALRAAMEAHLKQCKRCTAVLDGSRNVIQLYADDRLFELPAGFSRRLRQRIAENMPRPRGSMYGWLVAVAAAALITGGLAVANSPAFRGPVVRSEHARVGKNIPVSLMVVVSEDSKLFHVPGCEFIHDNEKTRLIAASDAIDEGYVPCVRCLRKYLSRAEPGEDEQRIAGGIGRR
jgi:hypothetical protein